MFGKCEQRRTGLASPRPSGARRAILGLLLLDPEKEWHLREIARRTGLSPATVHAEVRSLVDAGILHKRVEARRACYRANTECPIFPELRQIMIKTAGLADVIRHALESVPAIGLAFIFGSMAKGTADAGSDIDVLVVTDAPFGEVSAALLPAQEQLGREIVPVVYSPDEFRDKLAAKHHFLLRVLGEPRITLIGNAGDFA